jgi:hypothetical protein
MHHVVAPSVPNHTRAVLLWPVQQRRALDWRWDRNWLALSHGAGIRLERVAT